VFWTALVGTRDLLELAVGAGAASSGAFCAALVRRRGGFPSLPFRRRTWARAAVALARIPSDLLLIGRAFRARGSLSTVRLGPGTDWRHRAECGLAELFGSLAPNEIVLDVSAEGDAELHTLVRRSRR
jgi:hypothetical protein